MPKPARWSSLSSSSQRAPWHLSLVGTPRLMSFSALRGAEGILCPQRCGKFPMEREILWLLSHLLCQHSVSALGSSARKHEAQASSWDESSETCSQKFRFRLAGTAPHTGTPCPGPDGACFSQPHVATRTSVIFSPRTTTGGVTGSPFPSRPWG